MRHVHELIVAGRPVMRDGAVLGIDYPTMRDDMLTRRQSNLSPRRTPHAASRGML